MSEKLLNKILKKVEQIEKMHDKESILCEEVIDLIEEIKESSLEEDNQSWEEEDLDDEDFDEDEEEDIDEEDDK